MTKGKVRVELQLNKIDLTVKQIDKEMPSIIKSNFNEQIAIISQEQWTAKQCLIEEEFS